MKAFKGITKILRQKIYTRIWTRDLLYSYSDVLPDWTNWVFLIRLRTRTLLTLAKSNVQKSVVLQSKVKLNISQICTCQVNAVGKASEENKRGPRFYPQWSWLWLLISFCSSINYVSLNWHSTLCSTEFLFYLALSNSSYLSNKWTRFQWNCSYLLCCVFQLFNLHM